MGMLRSWSVEQVRKFFERFYRPDNATLYVVGDVALSVALRSVNKILGDVRGEKAAENEWRAIRDKWRHSTVKQQ